MIYGYVIVKVNPGTDPEEFDWEPEEEPAFFRVEDAVRDLDLKIKANRGYYHDAAIVKITLERVR